MDQRFVDFGLWARGNLWKGVTGRLCRRVHIRSSPLPLSNPTSSFGPAVIEPSPLLGLSHPYLENQGDTNL